MTPEQGEFTPRITLPSIDWNKPSDGQRLRAEFWKRHALRLHAKLREQMAQRASRGFRHCRGQRLAGF